MLKFEVVWIGLALNGHAQTEAHERTNLGRGLRSGSLVYGSHIAGPSELAQQAAWGFTFELVAQPRKTVHSMG